MKLIKNKIKTLFLINKEDYFSAVEIPRTMIDAYRKNMHPYYLELAIDGLNVEYIFKVFEFLHVMAECYKRASYKDFNQDDKSWYKYLCPIVPIDYFVEGLTNYYGFTKDYFLEVN